MNPKQIGDVLRSLLLAAGVSGSILGYVGDEVWLALGGVVFAVGAGIAQVIASRTKKLIEDVAADPVVDEIVLTDAELAKAIPSPKVVPLD